MPPRAPLQTSFSVTDVNNEVVCPLHNQDGSHCRKRCLGVSLAVSFAVIFLSLLLALPVSLVLTRSFLSIAPAVVRRVHPPAKTS